MSDIPPVPVPPSPATPYTGPRTSTMAIISLIGGITGFTVLPGLGSIAGIIFGHIAKSEIKKSNGTLGGNGMATAGLIMGYVTLGLGICALCITLVFPAVIAALGLGSYYNY